MSADLPRNFSDLLSRAASRWPSQVAYSQYRHATASWDTVSFAELEVRCRELAARMRDAGLEKGDRVVLLGETSIDWVITFYALMLNDAVAIPLDTKLNERELSSIMSHAGPKWVFSSETFRDLSRRLRHTDQGSAKVFSLGSSWPQGMMDQAGVEDPESIAVICYTSGTLGAPKGVMLRKGGLIAQLDSLAQRNPVDEGSQVAFSILPLNHIYGLVGGPLFCLRTGFELCLPHAMVPEEVQRCLVERRVQQLFTIPLHLKVIRNEILGKVRAGGALKEKVFSLLLGLMGSLPFLFLQRLFFRQIHQYFGGNLEKIVSGGAPLPLEVDRFWRAVGIPVFEGYGLTETGPVIAVNDPQDHRSGTVGKPLPGVDVRISPEGEIETRSDSLFVGYWRNPELTLESFTTDGWFRTGDFGELKDGFLAVKGRKKSLIVLSSGKKIHPEEVECLILSSPMVRFCCMLGLPDPASGADLPVLVIQPPEALINQYQGKEDELRGLVKAEALRICSELTDYKRPQVVKVMFEGIPMTPSFKIKRQELQELLRTESSEAIMPAEVLLSLQQSKPQHVVH
jgi:long-chain acyl-CoA synthetase